MRVRDVEIALVLAREMKSAADRDVEASLRLEQLREVFGAEQLDRAERARIQTALEMAGLAPRPSLLDAEPDEPIRFALGGAGSGEVTAPEAPASAEPARAASEPQRQEFPTVGEFARSAFARFRGRRARRAGAAEPPAVHEEPALVAEQAPEAEGRDDEAPLVEEPELQERHVEVPVEEPIVAEPEPDEEPVPVEPEREEPVAEDPTVEEATMEEPVAVEEAADVEEPDAEEPEPQEAEPESPNGRVDVEANGHAHLDFDAVEHVEPVDYDEPEAEDEPDADPEPEPEPAVQPTVAYEPPAERADASVGELAAVLLPVAAVPVLIASFAGWSFGLPFVALALIATGFLAGRGRGRARGGVLATLRHSHAARKVLMATGLVTVAALGAGAVLASVDSGGDEKSASTKAPPPKKPTPAPREPAAKAKQPKPKRHREKSSSPNDETQGLVRVPPKTQQAPSTGTTTAPGGTTTPGATPTTATTPAPSGTARSPAPSQQP